MIIIPILVLIVMIYLVSHETRRYKYSKTGKASSLNFNTSKILWYNNQNILKNPDIVILATSKYYRDDKYSGKPIIYLDLEKKYFIIYSSTLTESSNSRNEPEPYFNIIPFKFINKVIKVNSANLNQTSFEFILDPKFGKLKINSSNEDLQKTESLMEFLQNQINIK
ncbi:hypothetical protein [Flavobacterium sp. U410]